MGRLYNKIVRSVLSKIDPSGLSQRQSIKKGEGTLFDDSVIPVLRQTAADGMVLLKNNDKTLPIKDADLVSVFGRCAIDWFYAGYGSGGDVIWPYRINLMEGLLNAGVNINRELHEIYTEWTKKPKNEPDDGFWGHWPMNYPEMKLNKEIVKQAASKSDVALVVIGRAAGEDRENKLKRGSYYLTKPEQKMLDLVTSYFSRVALVINAGNIIDMSVIDSYKDKIGAIVYAWQGGMESGNAATDILTGKVNPSGKLTSTIAKHYKDYPSAKYFGNKKFNNYTEDIYNGYRYFETFAQDKILYPFGYGLSYTDFWTEYTCTHEKMKVNIEVNVKNTGDVPGREVIMIFVSAPQGKLGKPARQFVAFKKASLLEPGQSVSMSISFNMYEIASYDDSGITGHKSCYVLEDGVYEIYAGFNSSDAKLIYEMSIKSLLVVNSLNEVMAVKPGNAFMRMINAGGKIGYERVPCVTTDLKQRILDYLPRPMIKMSDSDDDTVITFKHVILGKNTLKEFVATLSLEQLDDISHGEGKMDSPLGVFGNAGALGGITASLRELDIPPVITADGPSGIRLKRTCALLACATCLASTFDTQSITDLYRFVAKEMLHHGVDLLLAPGMNIQRNVLCGRNFEYFSEDPLLTGLMAAAVVKGVQKAGASACPKHFACNNQETARAKNDSRVSERALREIYLKAFEITIKESSPHAIMTSYNKINGVWCHYGYEPVTSVLRDEWGYEGLVITDWWMEKSKSIEFPLIENDAYRVRSGVDVLMPGGDGFFKSKKIGRSLLDSYGKQDGITLGEMQNVAMNVLSFIQKSSAIKRIE